MEKPETVYLVTVRKDRTLKEMIQAGHYDWIASGITSEFFPNVGACGEYKLVLVHLNREEESAMRVILDIHNLGFEPAKIGQLLAFGEKYPKIQGKFPVVALGTVNNTPRGTRSPYIFYDSDGRGLALGWHGFGWKRSCRFLCEVPHLPF